MITCLEYSRRHGTEEWRHTPPPTHVVVDSYCPTTCPWDAYGFNHANEMARVLRDAGCHPAILCTRRRKLAPMGTGPKGRVRFGDDMMPSTHEVAVPIEERDAAMKAIAAHRAAIDAWLYHAGPMPAACRS